MTCDACAEGYEGRQCERCARGYAGDPSQPGGSCQRGIGTSQSHLIQSKSTALNLCTDIFLGACNKSLTSM